MAKESKLVIKPSGTAGARGEEFWFIQDRLCWLTRAELTEQPERCLTALTKVGFKVTLTQIENALTEKSKA